ncbi:hypothetical protein BaRGS_00037124 [Batillaria attramentaria]|uniref:Uncharacterized protein n=1 Tax=Batillaria attramentaria TaxID=370345 RepID=A0ABD0J9P6_9CAEN
MALYLTCTDLSVQFTRAQISSSDEASTWISLSNSGLFSSRTRNARCRDGVPGPVFMRGVIASDLRGSRARVSVVHDGDVPSLQYTYASPVTSPREATGKTPRFHHRIQRHIFRGRIKNW